ncbi:MAG: glycosyltransferase family 2 protein [Planctomycetes bacterium]|nr:glycosyltransferase family 2 protein [Planctomycetota bacterium]
MNLNDITPVVLTKNEEPNIGRCLDDLHWARRVVVLDSQSTDATERLAKQRANVAWYVRPFDVLATQWNHALTDTGIETPWILALDADYRLTPELLDELRALEPPADVSAYWARFVWCVWGRPLRGTAYGPIAVLFRSGQAHYRADGHAHRLVVERGRTETLRHPIEHDDRKSLRRFLDSQWLYMDLEARKLLTSQPAGLSLADRLRKTILLGPPLVLVYCLVWKLGLLDGWAGWYYALQRVAAETILSLKLIEHRLGARSADASATASKDRQP